MTVIRRWTLWIRGDIGGFWAPGTVWAEPGSVPTEKPDHERVEVVPASDYEGAVEDARELARLALTRRDVADESRLRELARKYESTTTGGQ